MGYTSPSAFSRRVGKDVEATLIGGRWYVTKEEFARLHNMRRASDVARLFNTTGPTIIKWARKYNVPYIKVGVYRVRAQDIANLEINNVSDHINITQAAECCCISKSTAIRIVKDYGISYKMIHGAMRFTLNDFLNASQDHEEQKQWRSLKGLIPDLDLEVVGE